MDRPKDRMFHPVANPDNSSAQRLLNALQEARVKIETLELIRSEPLAIVGMGCRFPGNVVNPEGFWQVLSHGVDAITEVPKDRWDIDALYDPDPDAPGKMCTRYGGFLPNVDHFDAPFFGISRKEAIGMDPQQRLLLEVCWEAIENAGIVHAGLRGTSAGVFMGIGAFDYAALRYMQQDYEGIDPYFATGGALSVAAGRLSYMLGLTGPSMVVDTACSSSLVAVHLACQSLRSRECDMALAGGVNVILLPELSINFSKAKMLAPDGRCKTFDASADGYVRSEGCGVVVLKRLSDAVADGDRILALIRGSAVNQDGPTAGLTVPSGPAQEDVIRRALSIGGVKAGDVGYIEAHGTGTSLGDPIEVGSLAKVFGGRSKTDPLVIGSVKTNIGHLEAAAGIAGLIKVVLSLQQGEIPPHLHFRKPSPHIAWEKLPFEIPTEPREWSAGKKRLAGVSAFGASGTNAHVVLEEGPVFGKVEPASSRLCNDKDRPFHLLALSAKGEPALKALAGRYAAHLADHPENRGGESCIRPIFEEAIADVCYTANTGRSHFEERLAVIGATREDIAAGCLAHQEGRENAGVKTGLSYMTNEEAGKIAFLFTGQGSQYAGMGRVLYETAPIFRAVMNQCANILNGILKSPLLDVIYSAEQRVELNDTAYSQPALFAVSYALFELWKSWGIEPSLVMGHDVGEYAAACASGVFSLEDGLKLVTGRGHHSSFKTPRIGIVSSLTGELTTDEMAQPDYWARHFMEPVKFQAGMETLKREGCGIFLEIGANPVLLEMGRRCLPDGYGTWLPSLQAGQNDWRRMLESLGALYGKGITPDWKGFDHDYERNKVVLPTYPFQRKRYWIKDMGTRRVDSRSIPGRTVHPLLGRRLPTAHRDVIFESRITKDSPSFLGDHRIYGEVVFPATGYVEMALAGGSELLRSEDLTIKDFSILQPLILPSRSEIMGVRHPDMHITPTREAVRLQTILHPEDAGGYAFEIFSETLSNSAPSNYPPPGEAEWRLHATGMIRSGRGEYRRTERLEDLKARCREHHSVEDHYRGFMENGIEYGPGFQGIEQLMTGERESLGFLRANGTVEAEMSEYRLHPGLFDASLQAASPIMMHGSSQENQIPVGIKRLRITSRLYSVLWSHARLRGAGDLNESGGATGRSPQLDFCLYDETGRAVVEVEGFLVKSATRETLLAGIKGKGDTALYTVIWKAAPLLDQAGDVSGRWMIFADAGGLGEKTAGALKAMGAEIVLVYRGESYTQEDEERYRVNPLEPEDFRRLLKDVLEVHPAFGCKGVLHLWSLDSGEETERLSIEQGKVFGCGSILHLVQALSSAKHQPRLWLATRGAQAVGDLIQSVSVHQSPLWGFQRVIALEHPEFRSVCIDLDPQKDIEEERHLLAELCDSEGPDGEDRIAYRGRVRYGARLIKAVQRKPVRRETAPRRMRIHEYGIIGNLTLEPMERRKPSRGEVEIKVSATGLNFRDVLRALGMLKEYEAQLQDASDARFGFECSGKIAAVGQGVEKLKVGDDVIAWLTVEGSLGSYVTVDISWVAKKPGWMSHEDAATIPLAFLTACYGLERLAKIRKGELVLIHAAAGGVGLAAIQIAQRAGARIYATASPGKWEYLKSLGVEAVMNSRTLTYAQEIKALTGGKGVDVILNSLTGEYIPKNLDILAEGGRFLEIGKIGIWDGERVRHNRPDVQYHPFDLGDVARNNPGLLQELLTGLMADFERGELKPLKRTVFGLDDGANAFRYMAQARHIGKVVLTAEAKGVRIRPDATYLITGGLGALGLETARWLVENGATNLVLAGRGQGSATAKEQIVSGGATGRSPLLEHPGVRVNIIEADIAKRTDVARLFELLSGMPQLKGIIHSAGVIDDGILIKQDMERFRKVLLPKVDGAWNLHEATLGLKLDFFVCYSSVASVIGSAGQSNYAAANAFLNGFVHERRRVGLHGLSINWGPWELGMAARLKNRDRERIAASGIRAIYPENGFRILEQLLLQDETEVCVLPVNWGGATGRSPQLDLGRNYRRVMEESSGRKSVSMDKSAILGKLEVTIAEQKRMVLLDYVQMQVAAVLGENVPDGIRPRQRLFDLGIDSLMAVELKNRLQSGLSIPLGATLVFDYPTVEALVDHLLEELFFRKEPERSSVKWRGDRPVAPTKTGDAESTPVDIGLEDASQDEIALMLAKELEAGKEN